MMKKITSLAASLLLTVTVLPAHADDWQSIGTGRMTDFIFTALQVAPTTFDVEIEKSTTSEGVYRIAEPFANFVNPDPSRFSYSKSRVTPMVIRQVSDNKFYFEQFNTGYTVDGLEIYGLSEAQFYIEQFHDAVLEVMPGVYGDFDGETFTYSSSFTFNGEEAYCLLMGWGDYDYACNIDGEFMIALPGTTDYSCSASVDAPCTADNSFGFDLVYSAQAPEVRYAVVAGTHRPTDGIFDSSIIGTGNVTDLHHLDLDLSGEADGMYTFMLAVLGSDGKIRSRSTTYFDIYHNDSQAWKEIGTASYTDDIVSSAYDTVSRTTYDVTVEESVHTPGLYRIVDPYGESFPHYALNRLSCTDHSHHIVIDATDPERVFLLPGALGFEVDHGAMHVCSTAWEQLTAGTSLAEIDRMNAWGRMDSDSRTISFPPTSLRTIEFSDKGRSFPSNKNGAFRLVLPEPAAISSVLSDDANAPVIYYDLLGRAVAEPRPGQLLIRRQGTRTDKTVVR